MLNLTRNMGKTKHVYIEVNRNSAIGTVAIKRLVQQIKIRVCLTSHSNYIKIIYLSKYNMIQIFFSLIKPLKGFDDQSTKYIVESTE